MCVRQWEGYIDNVGRSRSLSPDEGTGRADFSGADHKVERAVDVDRTEPASVLRTSI